ncbi:hypothetical protein F5H01DRAFT_323679 [Linnemannia elongata]|nr:hypothetical protein F5H01DRAFT_323679 [Linnemannia elongata]
MASTKTYSIFNIYTDHAASNEATADNEPQHAFQEGRLRRVQSFAGFPTGLREEYLLPRKLSPAEGECDATDMVVPRLEFEEYDELIAAISSERRDYKQNSQTTIAPDPAPVFLPAPVSHPAPVSIVDRSSSIPRHPFTRIFRPDGDVIRFKNESDTLIYIMYTQDLISAISNGGAGVNVGTGRVEMRMGVANELVRTKEIETMLSLAPNESKDVLIAPKYMMATVLVKCGETMRELHRNVLLKKGYNHTVGQADVNRAISESVTKEIDERV